MTMQFPVERTIFKVLTKGKATVRIAVSYDAVADVYRVCANEEFSLAAPALKRVEQLVAGLRDAGWATTGDERLLTDGGDPGTGGVLSRRGQLPLQHRNQPLGE